MCFNFDNSKYKQGIGSLKVNVIIKSKYKTLQLDLSCVQALILARGGGANFPKELSSSSAESWHCKIWSLLIQSRLTFESFL